MNRPHDSVLQVVSLTPSHGKELLIAEADDFDREVDLLRSSPAFQRFLDERSRSTRRVSLEAIEPAIYTELEAQGET
jgi:hypothetical protein